MHLRIALLGYGNVGRALVALLAEKETVLRERHNLTIGITGAMTRSAGGWLALSRNQRAALGISPAEVLATNWPEDERPSAAEPFSGGSIAFAGLVPCDVLVELTTLNAQTGQPALEHVRRALAAGKSVVTANKGPIAHAYRELRTLADTRHVSLRFESTVMDGTPIFNMAAVSLPATTLAGFRGLLNSTSNFVLSRMAQGETLEEAVEGAQRMGVAEANPANDLEGWDAAVKVTVLANVLMDADLRPADVVRDGLGVEAMRQAQQTLLPSQTLKQVAEAMRVGESVSARVRLEALGPRDVLAHLTGMEAGLTLHTDTMGDLTIIEGEGGPSQTAHGVMADLVAVATHPSIQEERQRRI
jgi:homoserine dehydrogenase